MPLWVDYSSDLSLTHQNQQNPHFKSNLEIYGWKLTLKTVLQLIGIRFLFGSLKNFP